MGRFARWLGVRGGEGRLVAVVAATFAAIEVGRGFGEIGADTLILSRFGAAALPYLFIGLGLVSLVVALGYGAALGRRRRGPLLVGMLAGIAALLVVERMGLMAGEPVLPLLWLSVYAAGMLAVTVAWTLAGAVFDARQAKRLFPLCTSAAIAGSFAGTLAAGPVARLVGAESLVLVEGVALAIAAGLVALAAREAAGARLSAPAAGRSMADEVRAGLEYVARSPLMRLVAVAYVLFSVLGFSVSYPFLIAMSGAFPSEADLATALGLLSAGVTLTSFVLSLTIANRLLARLGVAGTALLLPLVYVAGFALWLASFSVATAALFRYAQQVTQRGLSNAAWSAFYNVVPAERRGQVLAFNDGVPAQLGISLSGVLLLAAASFLAPDQVFWLGLAAALALTAVVVAIRRRYGESLVRTLRSGLGEQILEGGPGLAGLAHDAQVIGSLVDGLASSEPSVRRMAANLLGRIGARDGTDRLVTALGDDDAGVRAAALEALGQLGAVPDARFGPAVAGRLSDPDPAVRVAAVRAAAILDGQALAGAADRLAADASPSVRAALAVALVRADEEDRPHALLQGLLESPRTEDRVCGLEAVGELGGHAPSERMPELLHDPSADVRAAAVRAVAATGDWRNGATGAVLAALADEAPVVRRAAAAVLRERPEPPAGLIERLEAGSGDEQDAVLAALDGHGERVRPQLLAWAEKQVARAMDLRRQHAALLATAGDEGPERSGAFLAFLMGRRREEIERRLLQTLAVLGAPEASGLIRRCLRSGDPDVRAQAVEALDSVGDRRLGGAIVRLLDDMPDQRPGARDEVLRRLFDDDDPWIRALALRARADALTDDWAQLRDRALTDANAVVRRVAGAVVEQGGPVMPETVRALGDVDRMLFLRRVPLFEGLAPEDLQRVAATATERAYAAGEALVREGELGDELVVILEGSVQVLRDEGGQPRLIRRFGPGDHIGELAVLRERPRAATVTAEEPGVRGLVIGGQALMAILRERPEAAMAMLATLAERISVQ